MLSKHGLSFIKAKHARDLGISITAGVTRPAQLSKQRLAKSANRIKKISKIAKISRRARRLFTGSAFTMATWGHQAAGLSSSQVIQLERDALSCSGITTAGRCRTTALLVAYGINGTPQARIVRETIRDWFGMLRQAHSVPNMINDIRVAWARAKQHVIDNNNISCVKGIMSNVIYILNQAKWVPRTFDCWEDPQGSAWIIKDYKTAPDIVAAAITRSYLEVDLPRAAQHYNGLGMQEGIDADNTIRYLRTLKSDSNVDYGYKAMLETIMSGAMWPATRIASIRPLFCTLCPRCQLEPETPLHTFWTCPCNKQIDEPIIQNTDKYIQYAVQEEHVYPCLWFRGILPKKFTDINIPEPTDDLCVTHINPDNAHWSSGIYYGDASGGQHTQYNAIRRIGVGFILSDEEGCTIHGAHFNLPGTVQTVTRGELFSLVVLIRFLEPLSTIEFVTDKFNVYRPLMGAQQLGLTVPTVTYMKRFLKPYTIKHFMLS